MEFEKYESVKRAGHLIDDQLFYVVDSKLALLAVIIHAGIASAYMADARFADSIRQTHFIGEDIFIMHDSVRGSARVRVAGVGPDGMRFFTFVNCQSAVITVEAF